MGQSYDVRLGARMGQSFSYSLWPLPSAPPRRTARGNWTLPRSFFELIISTIRVDPNWQARINQHAGAIVGDRAKKAVSESRGDQSADPQPTSAISAGKGGENQQKSEDHVFGQFKRHDAGPWRTIGIPLLVKPSQLSNQYGHGLG